MTYKREAPSVLEGTEGRLWFRCRRCGDVLPERIWSQAEARRLQGARNVRQVTCDACLPLDRTLWRRP